MHILKDIFKYFKDSIRDILPIIIVICIFQFGIIRTLPDGMNGILVGLGIVLIGLTIFLVGLKYGIFPLGDRLAVEMSQKKKIYIVLFGILIGFSSAIAEPALTVIADKAFIVSDGRLQPMVLRTIVALSVGSGIGLGIYSMLKNIAIYKVLLVGYLVVVSITYFSPKEIIGLAFDLGGVATSTITVPLITAIGIGISKSLSKEGKLTEGFGLIGYAALAPMIFMQIYGIIVYNFFDASALNIVENVITEENKSFLLSIWETFRGVIPIILTISFFQIFLIRKKIPFFELKEIIMGFLFVIFGLYLFIQGLEIGIFNLGDSMAKQLVSLGNFTIIYLFAFAIGFASTMAEPTLIAIASKAAEVSKGKISSLSLRIFVAIGVGVGITLGAYRIISGGDIQNYLIIGYLIVIALTFLAPKHIIPIAYDSGGVTTSTITVPLVTALGLGLATNIAGRDVLLDGFGLIAFASLFPIMSVLFYGIKSKTKTDKDKASIFADKRNYQIEILEEVHKENKFRFIKEFKNDILNILKK